MQLQRYYAAGAGQFHVESLGQVPADAVPITPEEHEALLAAQDRGLRIVPGADGHPVAVESLAPTLDEAVAAKAREIRAGYDTALAGVLAGAEATATGVAVGSALMAVTDPDGLEYLVALLTARRVELEQALLVAQADADPAAAVLAIVVSYPT